MSDIFTNQAEVVQGVRDSAAAVGLDPDKVMPTQPQFVMVAKKNCRMCWGQGAVRYTPSPTKDNMFYNTNKPLLSILDEPDGGNISDPKLFYCKCVKRMEI